MYTQEHVPFTLKKKYMKFPLADFEIHDKMHDIFFLIAILTAEN